MCSTNYEYIRDDYQISPQTSFLSDFSGILILDDIGTIQMLLLDRLVNGLSTFHVEATCLREEDDLYGGFLKQG